MRLSEYAAKNLYNLGNYTIRQSWLAGDGYIPYTWLDQLLQAHEAYRALPSKVSQLVLKQFDHNWQSFFAGLQTSYLLPVLARGVLGLAVSIRATALALAPVVVVFVLLGTLPKKAWGKSWVISSLLFGISFLLVLSPHTARAYQQNGTIYLFDRFLSVMERSNTESEPLTSGKPGDNKLIPSAPIESPLPQRSLEEDTIVSDSLRHFVHNEITSVLILPLNWQVTILDEVVQQPRWDYRQSWQGELSTAEKFALGVHLLILSIGIGYAFRHWRFAGLTPLGIHMGYHLSNAIPLTSGGRYLVPVDWQWRRISCSVRLQLCKGPAAGSQRHPQQSLNQHGRLIDLPLSARGLVSC